MLSHAYARESDVDNDDLEKSGLIFFERSKAFSLHPLVGLRKPLVLDVDFELHH